MTSAGLTEADIAKAPPGVDADRAVHLVQEYVANPPDEDDVVPNLIPELGRFLLNSGQAERGLQVFSELARVHTGWAYEGALQDPDPGSEEMEHLHEYWGGLRALASVYDIVEGRLAAASGRTAQADTALMRLIARYPEADPEDSLSPGHYRVAAAHWQLAEIHAAAGRLDKAEEHRTEANRFIGVQFGRNGGGAGN
jgi:hypothetical protein